MTEPKRDMEKLAEYFKSKHDTADNHLVAIHKNDLLEASTLLRALAEEKAGLRDALVEIKKTPSILAHRPAYQVIQSMSVTAALALAESEIEEQSK